MYLNNSLYDKAKWLVLVFMPALAVLVSSLGDLFAWEQADVLVAVINLFAVFLGSLMQLSSQSYYKKQKDEEVD